MKNLNNQIESFDGKTKVHYNGSDEVTTFIRESITPQAEPTSRTTYVNGDVRMREEKTTEGVWVVTFPVIEVRDSGVVEPSDECWQSAEAGLAEKPLHEFTNEEVSHYEHRASLTPKQQMEEFNSYHLKPVPDDCYVAMLHRGEVTGVGSLAALNLPALDLGKLQLPAGHAFTAVAKESIQSGALVVRDQISIDFIEKVDPVNITGSLIDTDAPGWKERIENGTISEIGTIGAKTIYASQVKPEGKLYVRDSLGADFPTVHVILKDGKIEATNDEPGHLEGIWSIPYRPMKDEDDGMLFRAMYEAVKNDDSAFLLRMDNIALDWEGQHAPTFDQFRDAIREAMDASKAAAELASLADRHDAEGN